MCLNGLTKEEFNVTGISIWVKNGGLGSLTYDDAMPKTGHTAGVTLSLGSRKFSANFKLLNPKTCDANHVATWIVWNDVPHSNFNFSIACFFWTGSTTNLFKMPERMQFNLCYCCINKCNWPFHFNGKYFFLFCWGAKSTVSISNPIRRSGGYWTGIIRQTSV